MDINTVTSVIDTVSELSKKVQNFGAGIVAITVILVIFIIIVLIFLAVFRKMFDNFIKTYQEMLNKLIHSSEEGQDVLKQSVEIANEAKCHLQYACGATHCDRSAAYVFHNGTRTLGGSHLLKFSCLVEYSNITQYCDGGKYQGTPIGEIWDACSAFLESGLFAVWDVNTLNDDSPVKKWMSTRKIRAAVAHAVYDDKGNIIGFVVNEYIKFPPPANSEEGIINVTRDLANRMVMAMDLELI